MTTSAAGPDRTTRRVPVGVGRVLACAGAVTFAIGVTAGPVAGLETSPVAVADPAEDFVIDLYTVVRDDPGTETPLGSWTVPDELRGRTCVATSTPESNSSIHPGNDLRIASAATITLADVEGTGEPVSSTDPITLGDQVEVTLIMGPDGVYSAGLAISFDCLSAATTTTTVPCEWNPELPPDSPDCVPPATTTTTTTTVVGNNPPTTSTTTSTTLPCEWDPDLEPDDPACTTTTIEVDSNPPTTVGSGGNSPTTVSAELPRTGSSDTMLGFGALLFVVGGALVLSARRRHDLV